MSDKRDAALDSLRAVAALSIAIGHIAGFVPGFLPAQIGITVTMICESGMAIFFALSGYLITLPYLRALMNGTPLPSTGRFALRRVARILPAYYFFWILSAVTTRPSLPVVPSMPDSTWGMYPLHVLDWISAATFTQLYNASAIRAYFVMPQMWSLTIELIFYAAVPFMAALAARKLSVRALSAKNAFLGLGAIWSISLAATTLATTVISASWSGNAVSSVVVTAATIGGFCPGIALVILRVARERGITVRVLPGWTWALVFCAGLVATGSVFAVSNDGRSPVQIWHRQTEAICAAILIAVCMRMRAGWWRRLTMVLAPVGAVSYSIYVSHWFLLRELVAHHLLGPLAPGSGLIGRLPALGLAVAVMLSVATLSYFAVERPAMRWAARGGKLWRPRRRQLAAG